MKKIIKFTVLSLVVCLFASAFCGCGKKDFTEQLALITGCVDEILARKTAEVVVSEDINPEADIEGVFVKSFSETHIRFDKTEDLQFRYEKNTAVVATEEVTNYQLIKMGDNVFELFDGEGDRVKMDEADFPDFLESFRIGYAAEDVVDVTDEIAGGGMTLYTLKMSDAFADKLDAEIDGVTVNCTDVTYGYYIDKDQKFVKQTVKYTYKVTAEGQTQTVERQVTSEIA